ncbi:MAG TPA: LPS assembly lipoprotein LptE [Gemmatimonadales bacterium]|nr:LPS assembly lipoprotein LptE [Gemmatimonadales bacterium]
MAVLPFDNLTAEPALTQQVNLAVREAVESRLGLRAAAESQADAVVKGTITRYEPDLPVAFTGNVNTQNQQQSGTNEVDVTRRLVQLSVNVEIRDEKNDKVLWQRQGLIVEGDYAPGSETDGRRKALERLTVNIVEGAQSQW